METVTTNYTTMFKAIHTTFALTSHITVFQCWKISSVYNRKAEPHFFSTMKVISVFQSLAESVLSFLCFCLTSHRLLPRLAESRVDFFFFGPLCVVTSLSWRDYVRGRKTFRKNERKRQKCSKAVVTEPLFSTHCLRFATMHTKHNKEWLKQTQGKQIRTRYSSWLSSFVLPSLHVICFFQFGFFF